MEKQDLVCILYGCSVPAVLREGISADGSRVFMMIGECFVYGMMNEEALKRKPRDDETCILV